ncbi:MAG TPA: insulinase family protein [Roseovarius sp.]
MSVDNFAGFTEIASCEIPELATRARHFRHGRTGADAVFLLNADAAQTFAISFRTPSADSTGVAHVLEHCVLSGSRAYPAEKPFAELLKGSLQSYLNASTFADFTIYPVASPHPTDFRNLVDVYLDAVFFPLLTEECFRREAWHLAADGTPQGVVLNEMRGMCASPVYLLADQARRSLFRTGPFSHAYGGDPDRITDLTHAAMTRFHRAHYHPSNALAAYSGVDDIQGELPRLDRIFSQFERCAPHLTPTGQVITAPRTLAISHAEAGPSRLALNWAFPAPDSRLTELACDILCEALVGQPFAPLRRGLIDGGHGTDVTEGRYCDDTWPPRLSIQLAGADADSTEGLLAVMRETMERLLQDGFDRHTLAGALNAVEFRNRDRSSRKRPHVVGLLLDVAKGWRLGRDPLHGLGFAPELAELRAKPAGFFEEMLKTHLLENPRFTLVALTPAAGTRKAPMRRPSDAVADDPAPQPKPRAAACIPRLALSDLSPGLVEDPMTVDQMGEVPVLLHQRQTNGLVYVDLALDLRGLPDLSCAALFARVLLRSGTARRSARDMANRIGAETGGLSCEVISAPLATGKGDATRLVLRGRALAEDAPSLFGIFGELLSEWQIPEPPYLSEIVRSEINRVRAQILPKAHEFLDRRLRRHDNAAEQTDGLTYLQFLHDFWSLIRRDPDQARQHLRESHAALACRKRLAIGITSGTSGAADLRRGAERLVGLVPAGAFIETPTCVAFPAHSEGFIVPGEANFVGMAVTPAASEALRPAALAVGLKYLETGWIRQKLREEGGAYGALCRGDLPGRPITFLSYRDPHILRSLDVFAAAGQQLERRISRDDLTRAIIATIGRLDRPLSPQESGLKALTDWLAGWSGERRAAFRAEVLATVGDDVQNIGKALIDAGKSAHIVLFGSKEVLSSALDQRPDLFEIRNLPGE